MIAGHRRSLHPLLAGTLSSRELPALKCGARSGRPPAYPAALTTSGTTVAPNRAASALRYALAVAV